MKEALARFLESQWPEAKGLRVVSLEQGTEGFSQETFFFDVELPTAETPVVIPDWLAPCLKREVTEDPAWTNLALAR